MNTGGRGRVERRLAAILAAENTIVRWAKRCLILLLALGLTQALTESAADPQPYRRCSTPAGRCASKPTYTGRQGMDRSLW